MQENELYIDFVPRVSISDSRFYLSNLEKAIKENLEYLEENNYARKDLKLETEDLVQLKQAVIAKVAELPEEVIDGLLDLELVNRAYVNLYYKGFIITDIGYSLSKIALPPTTNYNEVFYLLIPAGVCDY